MSIELTDTETKAELTTICSDNEIEITDKKPTNTVLIEAMILGRPTLVTNCSGCREVVNNGEFGLMADQNDQTGLGHLLQAGHDLKFGVSHFAPPFESSGRSARWHCSHRSENDQAFNTRPQLAHLGNARQAASVRCLFLHSISVGVQVFIRPPPRSRLRHAVRCML